MAQLATGDTAPSFKLQDQDPNSVQEVIRSSFLIDERGEMLASWYKVKPEDTMPQALEVLKSRA